MEVITTIQVLKVVAMVRYLMGLLDTSAVDLPCTNYLLRYAVTTMSCQNLILPTLHVVVLVFTTTEHPSVALVTCAQNQLVRHVVEVQITILLPTFVVGTIFSIDVKVHPVVVTGHTTQEV